VPRQIPSDRFHELLQAATAVFLERGSRRTQMADVAARLGVAKGTLYLAAVWYETGREGALDLLRRYLEDRIGRRHLRPGRDVAVTARIVLETLVFWAVHRHWDPAPQACDDATAESSVVEFVLRALLPGETP